MFAIGKRLTFLTATTLALAGTASAEPEVESAPLLDGVLEILDAKDRVLTSVKVSREGCEGGHLSPIYPTFDGRVLIIELSCLEPDRTHVHVTMPIPSTEMAWGHRVQQKETTEAYLSMDIYWPWNGWSDPRELATQRGVPRRLVLEWGVEGK